MEAEMLLERHQDQDECDGMEAIFLRDLQPDEAYSTEWYSRTVVLDGACTGSWQCGPHSRPDECQKLPSSGSLKKKGTVSFSPKV